MTAGTGRDPVTRWSRERQGWVSPDAYGTVGDAAVKPLVQETGRAISSLIWAVLAIVIGVPAAGIYFAVKNPKLAGEMAKGLLAMKEKGRG